jgi:hypothetical protein
MANAKRASVPMIFLVGGVVFGGWNEPDERPVQNLFFTPITLFCFHELCYDFFLKGIFYDAAGKWSKPTPG